MPKLTSKFINEDDFAKAIPARVSPVASFRPDGATAFRRLIFEGEKARGDICVTGDLEMQMRIFPLKQSSQPDVVAAKGFVGESACAGSVHTGLCGVVNASHVNLAAESVDLPVRSGTPGRVSEGYDAEYAAACLRKLRLMSGLDANLAAGAVGSSGWLRASEARSVGYGDSFFAVRDAPVRVAEPPQEYTKFDSQFEDYEGGDSVGAEPLVVGSDWESEMRPLAAIGISGTRALAMQALVTASQPAYGLAGDDNHVRGLVKEQYAFDQDGDSEFAGDDREVSQVREKPGSPRVSSEVSLTGKQDSGKALDEFLLMCRHLEADEVSIFGQFRARLYRELRVAWQGGAEAMAKLAVQREGYGGLLHMGTEGLAEVATRGNLVLAGHAEFVSMCRPGLLRGLKNEHRHGVGRLDTRLGPAAAGGELLLTHGHTHVCVMQPVWLCDAGDGPAVGRRGYVRRLVLCVHNSLLVDVLQQLKWGLLPHYEQCVLVERTSASVCVSACQGAPAFQLMEWGERVVPTSYESAVASLFFADGGAPHGLFCRSCAAAA